MIMKVKLAAYILSALLLLAILQFIASAESLRKNEYQEALTNMSLAIELLSNSSCIEDGDAESCTTHADKARVALSKPVVARSILKTKELLEGNLLNIDNDAFCSAVEHNLEVRLSIIGNASDIKHHYQQQFDTAVAKRCNEAKLFGYTQLMIPILIGLLFVILLCALMTSRTQVSLPYTQKRLGRQRGREIFNANPED
ncbi:hypothetical protein AB4254_07970 [Vibrio breoganii]